MKRRTVKAFGLTMLNEAGCYPGGKSLGSHKDMYVEEKELFEECLSNVHSENPVMIEIGSYWALWSLLFRKKFPTGRNILIELFEELMEVGVQNFELNGFTERVHAYHGGIGLEESRTYKYVMGRPDRGEELDLMKIVNENNIDAIDVLHCDIQGSEMLFLETYPNLFEDKIVKNIVIGTHSGTSDRYDLHGNVLKFLENKDYEIVQNFPDLSSDGHIYAKIK